MRATTSTQPNGTDSMQATPLFFFGTLTDADVLEIVLARHVEASELVPATLAGFRRVAVAGAPYPALLPRSGGCVAGTLFRPRGPRELVRIAYFEAGYRLRRCRVTVADGRPVACAHWRTGRGVRLSPHEWSATRWNRCDKPTFLRSARAFMRGFERRDPR